MEKCVVVYGVALSGEGKLWTGVEVRSEVEQEGKGEGMRIWKGVGCIGENGAVMKCRWSGVLIREPADISWGQTEKSCKPPKTHGDYIEIAQSILSVAW